MDNSPIVSHGLLPGETVPRTYFQRYESVVKYQRKAPVDFSVIPELRTIIEASNKYLPLYPDVVLDHLTDAANEDLPLYAREQHFDIAGSIVWNCMMERHLSQEYFDKYIKLFVEANGV